MRMRAFPTAVFAAILGCGWAAAQPTPPAAAPAPDASAHSDAAAPPLGWTPPALVELSSLAAAKESFTLDRTMLAAAAELMPDSDADVKRSVAKLDGVSIHLLRFGQPGMIDPAEVEAIRAAYHARGWKHLVATERSGAQHNDTTDVWMAMDGANLRCAVVMVESPKSLTLATVSGNLSPVDLLHLRGHFWIPKFATGALSNARER